MSSGLIVALAVLFVLWTCLSVGSESGEKEAIYDDYRAKIEQNMTFLRRTPPRWC